MTFTSLGKRARNQIRHFHSQCRLRVPNVAQIDRRYYILKKSHVYTHHVFITPQWYTECIKPGSSAPSNTTQQSPSSVTKQPVCPKIVSLVSLPNSQNPAYSLIPIPIPTLTPYHFSRCSPPGLGLQTSRTHFQRRFDLYFKLGRAYLVLQTQQSSIQRPLSL
jgi:hypothetical protein